jgi:ferredoxin
MSATIERDFGTPPSHATQTVTLEIDGMPVAVPAGTSVMRAAAEAGISVPKLCATDSLEPFGSCRLCLVEIEGRKGFPASCTTPAEAGMVEKPEPAPEEPAQAEPSPEELTRVSSEEEERTDAKPRTFVLQRDEDESGVSGTGEVAHGVLFDDGKVAMRWRTKTAATTLFDSIAHVLEVHGHGGATRIIWDDERTDSAGEGEKAKPARKPRKKPRA